MNHQPILQNKELLESAEKQIEYLKNRYGSSVGCHKSHAFINKWFVYRAHSVSDIEYIAVGTFEEIPYTIEEEFEGKRINVPYRKVHFVSDEETLKSMNARRDRRYEDDEEDDWEDDNEYDIPKNKSRPWWKRLFGIR